MASRVPRAQTWGEMEPSNTTAPRVKEKKESKEEGSSEPVLAPLLGGMGPGVEGIKTEGAVS